MSETPPSSAAVCRPVKWGAPCLPVGRYSQLTYSQEPVHQIYKSGIAAAVPSMSVPSVPIETQAVPESQEQQYVHDVYNQIAPHFSQTRYKPWPIVERFLRGQADYAIGIDVGCGNGKYLGVNPKLVMVGSDRSDGLVACAQENSANQHLLAVADGLHLPHADGRFDFAISIAVIHHFATEERRIHAIRHILSKLRPGGRLLVYCWALEQATSRRGYKEGDDQDILIPWVLNQSAGKKKERKREKGEKGKGKEKGGEEEEKGGEEKEEQEKNTKYRYYHLYKEGELTANAVCAGGEVVDSGYEKDNWWAVIARPE